MPPPLLSSFAQDLYDRLAPLAQDDATNGYALAEYCAGVGAMFQEIEDYARDTDVGSGWSSIVDINRAPSKGLAWLAQFVGVTLQAGLSDAAQRARIRATDGWNRGTVQAIIAAAQQYLTGAQTVIIRERDSAASPALPAYGLTVITYTSQTPDSNKVLAALLLQKPAGIILNYHVLPGQDYQSLFSGHANYQNVFTTYATYQGIVTDQPGT